ncbi:spermidine synthase [Microbulbifer sp.]|uniref:spermidine synthase n=1 Tax=Microbulbifer sp. TaxID=1908541 RepID=UPI003F2FC93E
MAVVWQRQVGGNCYQVRRHGASVRLYSNGILHSQWNPRDPLKGSFWELLLLPAFFLPPRKIRSVLVLGVGGGAMIRLLQQFVEPECIVGVDLDPVHLSVARRYFDVRDAELVCADAREYVAGRLAAKKQSSYDLIVDDLFGHDQRKAERTVAADPDWCKSLLQLLTPDGLVVSNFGSRREMITSGWRHTGLREQLASWSAEMPQYENCVLTVSRRRLAMADLVARAPGAINPQNPRRRLKCRLRRL